MPELEWKPRKHNIIIINWRLYTGLGAEIWKLNFIGEILRLEKWKTRGFVRFEVRFKLTQNICIKKNKYVSESLVKCGQD